MSCNRRMALETLCDAPSTSPLPGPGPALPRAMSVGAASSHSSALAQPRAASSPLPPVPGQPDLLRTTASHPHIFPGCAAGTAVTRLAELRPLTPKAAMHAPVSTRLFSIPSPLSLSA